MMFIAENSTHDLLLCERDHLKAVNADLLAALEAIANHSTGIYAIKIARAAIAKAQGELNLSLPAR